MKTSAKTIAVCSMAAALTVVVMALGALLELGMYACPMFAGLFLMAVGQKYGRKYQLAVFTVSAALCFLLVPNVEENLMFAGFLGWYPLVRPVLQKLPGLPGWICKLALFNGCIIAIQWLVMTVLVPELLPGALLWVLLALGNITFLAYDYLLPRAQVLLGRLTKLL